MQHIALITPSISSLNLGDSILFNHIQRIVTEMFPNAFLITIPAYNRFDERSKYIMDKCDFAFFCGTGPLRNDLAWHWVFDYDDYARKVILLGVGWNCYETGMMKDKTRELLYSALSKEYVHSIRDNYAKNKLEMEFPWHDFTNTACPTMWHLPLNKRFKDQKSKNVLFTVNAMRGNKEKDKLILDMLAKNYETIVFYAQSPLDADYLFQINEKEHKILVIPSSIRSIDNLLKYMTIDYVGHRLHGGLNALHHGSKTFIIEIDNRATEMRNDFNIPSFEQDASVIEEAINSKYELNMNIPAKQIEEWKEQFR